MLSRFKASIYFYVSKSICLYFSYLHLHLFYFYMFICTHFHNCAIKITINKIFYTFQWVTPLKDKGKILLLVLWLSSKSRWISCYEIMRNQDLETFQAGNYETSSFIQTDRFLIVNDSLITLIYSLLKTKLSLHFKVKVFWERIHMRLDRINRS